MDVERLSVVIGAKDWDKDLSFYRSVFGEPTFVDGTRWAQFDIAGTRVCLAGEGEGVASTALMVKVGDLDGAASTLASAGASVEAVSEGAHEQRFAATHDQHQIICYLPR